MNSYESLVHILSENIDVQLDQIKTDNKEVLDAIETIKNYLHESKICHYEANKQNGLNSDYIYIHVSGISRDKKHPKGKGIAINNIVKNNITQVDVDFIYGKIKEMFTKQD